MDERDYDEREYIEEEWEFAPEDPDSGLTAAILLVIALTILVVSFVWFVIRLDPLTDDFIGTDGATPTATATAGAP